jgi:hypothetical protein
MLLGPDPAKTAALAQFAGDADEALEDPPSRRRPRALTQSRIRLGV